MARPSAKSDFFNMQVQQMHNEAKHAQQALLKCIGSASATAAESPDALGKSLDQFFNILSVIESKGQAQQFTTEEMRDLADHGLGLLNQLNEWAIKTDCDEAQKIFTGLCIPVALWCARQNISLSQLEPVVSALTKLANSTQDMHLLGEISDAVDVIIKAVAPGIKQDPDKSNPSRPWRMLNLNHGIVATRTHDPKRMEAVFEQLLYRLPEDAGEFFREGMEQMDRIGYPPHVRNVMLKYYELTNKPTLH